MRPMCVVGMVLATPLIVLVLVVIWAYNFGGMMSEGDGFGAAVSLRNHTSGEITIEALVDGEWLPVPAWAPPVA